MTSVFSSGLALAAEATGVIAANAPYVPTDAIPSLPPEARLHESSLALDGGVGGFTY